MYVCSPYGSECCITKNITTEGSHSSAKFDVIQAALGNVSTMWCTSRAQDHHQAPESEGSSFLIHGLSPPLSTNPSQEPSFEQALNSVNFRMSQRSATRMHLPRGATGS